MAVNLVVQDGVVKSPALRYASDGKAEYRFTLEQKDGEFTLWLPCFAPGAAGERLASALDAGMRIVITSGKLAYKKRATKAGDQSRLEILTWAVDVLRESPQDDVAPVDPALGMPQQEIVQPGGEQEPLPSPQGKPRYPKWKPSGLASEN